MRRRIVGATAAVLASISLLAPGPGAVAAGDVWCATGDGNTLRFIGGWEGKEFSGVFRRFDVSLVFDPQHFDQTRLEVVVDVTSATSDNTLRDQALADPDWFHFEQFPEARFFGQTVSARRDGRFQIGGTLEIKGRRHPVTLDFNWEEAADEARMRGGADLDRTWFAVGEGEWADSSVIAHGVLLEFDVGLTPCTLPK
jgi:polyisoprenoid-binding protein YceI